MIGPETLAEAQGYKYGLWYRQVRYRGDRCAYPVPESGGWGVQQCARKPGWGTDWIFCKQHAAKMAKREGQ